MAIVIATSVLKLFALIPVNEAKVRELAQLHDAVSQVVCIEFAVLPCAAVPKAVGRACLSVC